ncbi:sterile alpha motif domain-containing protein 9-like, partial [Scomber scombrus]
NPPSAETDRTGSNYRERPTSPTCPSLKSARSQSPPPDFNSGKTEDRNVLPVAEQFPVGGPPKKTGEYPPLMEEWTKEHVKDWLIHRLRVPQRIAQSLYDQELSGACLVSYEKQDLLELDVPRAPALQIMRQVEKFKRNSETFEPSVTMQKNYNESREGEQWKSKDVKTHALSANMDESVEVETVSSDSGIQSVSSTVLILEEARSRIRPIIGGKTTDDKQLHTAEMNDNTTFLQPMCQIRPFDQSNTSIFYAQNDIFPSVAGPSNLLDPVHEYQLLPSANEASEKEILYEFTKEVFSFSASCMNSRTNGTIHFGVKTQPAQGHGQVVGHNITSFGKYNEAFESCLSEYFEEQHINAARMCIRPPKFLQVHNQDGTTSDKWVIEVDVVPTYSETQENIFYTLLSITSTEKKQQSKTECLFVRDGPRSINILADPNPRIVQEQIKALIDKVKCSASARKSAEEKPETQPSRGHQGQRLKQLITRGRDAFENYIQVIVVTEKCHSSQLEHLDFLKEMKLFAILEFDPESDVNGTCSFYRRDRIANLHYPRMYTTQDNVTAVIGKLNLFKQTSWIFCNGRVNEEGETDKPLTPSEWLKKRSGDINTMISFLCNPDLLSKDGLLVVFILHSVVADISSPFLEAFCAMYRTLEGVDNMLCICKDSTVFNQWKQLIEYRCKEDITSKCIYELSLNEISSTIKKLKEPQTRSSQRYLPSTGSSSVLLTKKDEELMTVLDILCENECENTEIETKESFQEFKMKTEEHFYRGGQVSWWNFYLSEKPGCLPFIKRDKYKELYDLIMPVESYKYPCVMINLLHPPGCGGTTLAKHVLWDLRSKFRCAIVKNTMATNNEIAAQVMTLLTYGKQEQPGYTPVLLLLDNRDDVEDLKQCILNVASDRKRHNNLMVILLNCERTQFPVENSRGSRITNVFITNKLSAKEQSLFSEKLQQLKDYHEKPETFYAFMIMTNNFSEAYITNLVTNTLKDLDTTTQQGRLFSFLALLNTYVNGSYMSLSLCEELVGIRNCLWKRETLDDKLNPYSTLLITFTVEEHGTYQAVRFLHQMIASNCLKVITQKHKLSLAEITTDLLLCDKVYKSCMGKDFLGQNIQSMLITRHRKEQGDDTDSLFSPLIEEIGQDGLDKIAKLLEIAIGRFNRSATLPQALARHFYLKQKDFESALKWALDARGKKSNSYISDTVGQVYKSQLKKEMENARVSKDFTPEALDKCLMLGSKAVNAFRESQDRAKEDEQVDPFELHNKKRPKSYNTSGYVGETEVIMILLDITKELPLFTVRDQHQRDKMLQFLKGHHRVSNLYDHSNMNINQFVPVLADHEKFLVSLKPRLKEIFSFFENYFTYLRPRSVPQERVTADERSKQKVSEYFKKYLKIFSISEKAKASEKASNPNLSLRQEIEDQRQYLEIKGADSFAGLLQCLTSEIHWMEMEHILKKWQFIFDKSPSRYVSDTVNFILANIVLHSIKPSSKLLYKYEKLVDLLNEALQNEGTHSNLTELYYLSMLLMWPTKDQRLENSAAYKNISTYVTSAKKSFHRRFSHVFPARSAIAHFYLGKSNGLKRIVSKVRLDQILIRVSKQQASSNGQSTQQRNLHYLWQSGAAWKEPEVQEKLLRIKGKSENGDIYVNYGGNIKMLVRPVYLGDIRSGCSREEVSFYLGFTMEGPVAYDIRYENDQ